MARERDVAVDGRLELGDSTNSSAVCATWIEPGPNSSGWPQRCRNGMSVVYGNTAVSKPGTVVKRTGGTSRTCSIATRASSGAIACRTSARVADRAEHHFGLGRRRHDVGRDAAGNQPDV